MAGNGATDRDAADAGGAGVPDAGRSVAGDAGPGSPDESVDDQRDLLAYLGSGAPFGTSRISRIDTHAATIFLAGDRAWKIKRAVRFPYLDFSRVVQRHAALAAELDLNRRTAPTLYIALHPICRNADGSLALDGPGTPIDWILEMRRFPDRALLAAVAADGMLDDRLAMRLADRVASFHAAAEVATTSDGAAAVRAVIAGNCESMARYPAILPVQAIEALHRRSVQAADAAAAQLDRRARATHVRRCHGDLHLANIVLLDGEPTLFDCLEFDPALATTDTLYDLAFLLMDLWAHDLRRQANVVFNRYFDVSPRDEAGAALLPLFMSMRAAVRAHVHAASAAQSNGGDDEAGAQARRYLTLASRLLDPVPARLIAIGGLSGSGKSTLARAVGGLIGRAPGARILRSDVLRKRIAGVPPETRLPPAHYTRATSQRVYAHLTRRACTILATGASVVADGVFADPSEREAIAALADRRGAEFDGLWLDARVDIRVDRIGGRDGDASDADAAVARRQADVPEIGSGRWRRLPADADATSTASAALTMLALA